MDELQACAIAFENLLTIKYHIIIGRKGKSKDLTIRFEAVEFHHLVGLYKLNDLRLARANHFFCRSFFPKEDKDYTKGQAVYTLLKKEKINTSTGMVQIPYDRLSPKNKT